MTPRTLVEVQPLLGLSAQALPVLAEHFPHGAVEVLPAEHAHG